MTAPVVRWGVVLAGGRASRIGGGDKGERRLAGRPLLQHVIGRVGPQLAGGLLLNANGDPARFAAYGLTVVPDSVQDAGPLAGILAGLDWLATNQPAEPWLLSVPVDCPFLPYDLAARLEAACAGADIACAASGGRVHPVVGLWPVALRDGLRATLAVGERKVEAFTARHRRGVAEYATASVDPFLNVNRPEDLAEAERLAALP